HHIIYLLRRTLEPNLKEGGDSQYILSQHNAYQFNKSSNYWWDVHEFRENLQKAQQLWSSGEAEKAIEKIRRLQDLYTGDLLEDNLEETWCDFEREKLKEAFLELLLTAAAFYEEKQEYVMALEFANKALTLDPLREKTAHLLINLLYKSGKRTEAIRKYQTWRSQLEEEMNLKPSDEFATLYEKMTISSRIS
ncbi:MAG: bacterial transcriptional activator domain-containing protein, partial [Candidatus Eremiobacteraeota bacterium]|nr:bacterial transcriptional activator domain-containing protein [Candidatus Eremiobacteraeota bacterium]